MNGFKIIKSVLSDRYHLAFGGRGELSILNYKTAVVVENDLSLSQVETIVNKIDDCLKDDLSKRIWRDELGSDERILGFEQDFPELYDMLRLEGRIKEIEKYLGRSIKSWFLMANRVTPKENNLGSGGGWHRDSLNAHQVKFIWYLSDVSGDNGPFQYVPNSQRVNFSDFINYRGGETRFSQISEAALEVHGRKGDLLICDTKCIHRGKPIKSGHRYALTLYTSPNSNARKGRVVNLDD